MGGGHTGLSGVRAVVLAGGKGTRLRPFTVTFPKPLVPVGDRPILDRLLSQLAQHGIRHVTLALGHLSTLIRSYIGERGAFGSMVIDFVEEERPLGTAGSVKLVSGLDSTFLVMNGDLLTDIDFSKLVEAHRESGAALTIGRSVREQTTEFGVLEIDDDGFILGYNEKPAHTYSVSMGVYVYEPRVLDHMQRGEHLDFPDLILRLKQQGERVATYLHEGLWLDIGRPEDYARGQEIAEALDADTPEGPGSPGR